jgi:hypothetical protein
MIRKIKWIPSDEGMPPKGASVLVCLETELSFDSGVTRNIQEAELAHDGKWLLFSFDGVYALGTANKITHWAMMPEPPCS